MNRRQRGFTLLELMIVVIIIGILASLAMPRFIKAANKAKEAEAQNMLGAIRSSQFRYYMEHNTYTSVIGNLDVTIDPNPTDYYTYTSTGTAAGANVVVGKATIVTGTGLSNYQIEEDGDISTF